MPNVTDTDKVRAKAYVTMILAISDCIRDLGEVPSDHLYARLMDKLSIEAYQSIINALINTKVVREQNHLLTWIGPLKPEARSQGEDLGPNYDRNGFHKPAPPPAHKDGCIQSR